MCKCHARKSRDLSVGDRVVHRLSKEVVKTIRVAQIIGKMVNGGVESCVFNYYKNIDKEKFQFDFFCDSRSTVEPTQKLLDMGARFYELPSYNNIFSYMNALEKIFRENNYKIVHSHMNTLSVFSLRVAKKLNVPIRIAHSHSTIGKGEIKRNIIKRSLKPFANLYPTNRAACSRHAGKWLFGKKRDFTIFNNAIESENFSYNEKTRDNMREKFHIKDKFVIGHVGRFCYQKNQSFLVDILYECLKINFKSHLLLVGDGDETEKIKQKVCKMGLEQNVSFAGNVFDVQNFYQAMDVFVLPSRYEGLGIACVEAQISGLNIICSKNVPSEVKFTQNVEFVDLEKGARFWAEKINCFPQTKRKSQVESAKEYGFDIKTQVEKLEEYYSELLGGINLCL